MVSDAWTVFWRIKTCFGGGDRNAELYTGSAATLGSAGPATHYAPLPLCLLPYDIQFSNNHKILGDHAPGAEPHTGLRLHHRQRVASYSVLRQMVKSQDGA
jgi:hypothetical protein